MNQHHEKTITEFLTDHHAIIRKVAKSFSRDVGDHDDLTQEICISLLAAFDRLPNDVRESTYVYRIALNCAISWNRKRNSYLAHLKEFWGARFRESEAESTPSDQGEIEQLYAAVRKLPDSERSLIVMYLDGLTSNEMSDVVGVKQATVRKRLSRAKQKLSTIITSEEGKT